MAININGDGNKRPMAEINVTPLVDVVLVLLVVFMITAPLILNGIKLDLPKTKEVNRLNLTTGQVVLSLNKGGELYLGHQKYLQSELIGEIKAEFKKTKSEVIYVRADYGVRYGEVAKLMSFLKRGGISQIALVTEMEMDKKK
ncbi:MAG: biopolymer transporter ExbD [Pseudomonadota bacterium]